MAESTLHCAIEISGVLGCRYHAFVIVLVVHRLLVELPHTTSELLDAVRSMNDGIRFIELAAVALDLVADWAWSMQLVEVAFLTPCLNSFFAFEQCLEVSVYYERWPSAIPEIG